MPHFQGALLWEFECVQIADFFGSDHHLCPSRCKAGKLDATSAAKRGFERLPEFCITAQQIPQAIPASTPSPTRSWATFQTARPRASSGAGRTSRLARFSRPFLSCFCSIRRRRLPSLRQSGSGRAATPCSCSGTRPRRLFPAAVFRDRHRVPSELDDLFEKSPTSTRALFTRNLRSDRIVKRIILPLPWSDREQDAWRRLGRKL